GREVLPLPLGGAVLAAPRVEDASADHRVRRRRQIAPPGDPPDRFYGRRAPVQTGRSPVISRRQGTYSPPASAVAGTSADDLVQRVAEPYGLTAAPRAGKHGWCRECPRAARNRRPGLRCRNGSRANA